MASSRAFAATLVVITGAPRGVRRARTESCGARRLSAGAEHRTAGSPSSPDGGDRCTPGEHPLRLGNGRSARLRVTPGSSTKPRGLILAFHGAGGSPREGLFVFREAWERAGSRPARTRIALGSTWSALHEHADRDLETVNRALAETWRRCRIDPRRVAVGGFSDGATHALSIGLQNGGIFRSVMALSPGGLLDVAHRGKPRVFIAHGTGDDVLPYSRSRKSIVPGLGDPGTASRSGASPAATRYRRASRARPFAGTCASRPMERLLSSGSRSTAATFPGVGPVTRTRSSSRRSCFSRRRSSGCFRATRPG